MFVRRFLAGVRRWPEAVALLDRGQAWTYRALAERAAGLAGALHARGIGPEARIGVHVAKSASYVVACLAVWMARGAIVPLDPSLPIARKTAMAQRAGLALVLGRPLDAPCDGLPFLSVEASGAPIALEAESADLAYLFFSSGSTGQPKGVLVEQRGLVPMLEAQIEALGLCVGKRSLFLLATTFDASLSDIGTALLSGATLCLDRALRANDAASVAEALAQLSIAYVDLPPALLPLLAVEDAPPSLETVLVGGEPVDASAARRWAAKVRLFSVYGPTEATICTHMARCTPDWNEPLIGAPLPCVAARVVGTDGDAVAPGQAGELWLAGPLVARGYLDDPALDAQRFVQHEGVRYFRTGDRVTRRVGGSHVFAGRLDRQIKIRGQLTAPEEIEAALIAHPSVRRAAVVWRDVGGSSALVAFVEPERPTLPTLAAWRAYLGARLMPWMIPALFVTVDPLPLTDSGKPDVPQLMQRPLSTADDAPQSATEKRVARLLGEVLSRADVSRSATFWTLGGDSLSLLQVLLRAEAEGLALTVDFLTQGLTVTAIAALLDEADSAALLDEGLPAALLERATFLPAIARSEAAQDGPRERTLFITGATGFLGARVLRRVLRDEPKTRLVCLVRAEDDATARQRLETALEQTVPARLTVLAGDLTLDRFGLDPAVWARWCDEATHVFHLAAEVNDVKPYEALSDVNVEGTRTALRFALSGRPKAIDVAGTLSVFVSTDGPPAVACEDDRLTATQRVYGGYAQTKWVVDRMVQRAAEKTVVRLIRFGLFVEATPRPHDLLALFVRGLARIGAYPADEAERWRVDLTPCSYAADAFCALSRSGKTGVYHVANAVAAPLSLIVAAMQVEGVPLRPLSAAAWRETVLAQQHDALQAASFLALCRGALSADDRHRPLDLFQATGWRFDTARARAVLEPLGLVCPLPSLAWMRDLVRMALQGETI
jgi:amino acid adenylation domain-containing protein/thioester reductase-like protein